MRADDSFADNNFTPLRLGLALMVVLGHFQAFVANWSPDWPFNYSQAAVECFFVVSGYLVSKSYDNDSDARRFFVRRFFRIYPLYITMVLVQAVILSCMAPGGPFAHLDELGLYLLANAAFANFIQHDIGNVMGGLVDPSFNASLWTLKIEFAFYLILPLLWRGQKRYGPGFLLILFLLSAAYQYLLAQQGYPKLAKQLPGQLQYFLLGIAAYRYRELLYFPRITGTLLAVTAFTLLTFMMHIRPLLLYPPVVAIAVVALALGTRPLRMKTDISYGVYLIHAPVIQLSLLTGLYRHDWIGISGIVLVTLTLAAIAERLVERPGIDWGRRLAKRLSRPKPPPAEGLTVVVLNDFCHVQGGASKVAIDEAVGLADLGVRVIFVGAVGPICDQLRQAPLTVECLGQHELLEAGKHPGVIFQGLWNRKAGKRVHQILSGLHPDRTIVHLHGYTKALTTSPVRAAWRLGVPVICTLHDFFSACPNGAFFDYNAATPCCRKALSADCLATRCDKRHVAHKYFRVVRALIQRRLGLFPGTVTHFISLSDRSQELLAPYLPAGAHFHQLGNVVDADRLPPVAASGNRTILYVGRLDQEKGVLLLARTARELGLPVTFAGDGPLRAEIEKIPGMTVTGWLSRSAIQDKLTQARCLIFPSLWYETFGLTVAEAAARGVPAVVSDISAAAERIQDGVTGWRFHSGDSADLARCLAVIRDDRLVAVAGFNAYHAFWAEAPTLANHARGLMRIYRSAISAGVMAATN